MQKTRATIGVPKNLGHIKSINRKLALRSVWRHPGVSRAEVAVATHLTKTTVSTLVFELLSERLLVESGPRTGAVGRQPVGLEVNRRYGPYLAVDITPRALRVGVYDLAGVCVARREITPLPADPESAAAAACAAAREILPAGLFDRETFVAVGVSVPGRVDGASLGWRGADLGDAIRRELGGEVPVLVDTDAPLALRAEIWKTGRLEETATAVQILLNETVTAGIALDGKTYPGVDKGSANFGHMVVEPGGKACRCGGRGCWEAYVSVPALLESWRGAEARHEPPVAALRRLRAGYLAGEPAAKAALDNVAVWLAVGLANILCAVDPRTIVLGGCLSVIWDVISARVTTDVRERMERLEGWAPEHEKQLVASALDPDGNLDGAAIHALSATIPFDLFKDLVVSSMESFRRVL